jgi:hypothetical protein
VLGEESFGLFSKTVGRTLLFKNKLLADDETEVYQCDPKSKCIKTPTVEKSIFQKHIKCRCQS